MKWILSLAAVMAISAFCGFGCNDGAKGFSSPDGKCSDDATTGDCSRRCECRTLGKCKRTKDKCVEVSNEACKASEVCATMGACTLVDGQCAPASDADCAQSKLCRVARTCVFADRRCTDVKP